MAGQAQKKNAYMDGLNADKTDGVSVGSTTGGISSQDYLQPQQQNEQPNKYDYLKDMSAKDLLDSNVHSAVANEYAKMNLQKTIDQSGLGNTGYGATANAMIDNQMQREQGLNHRDYIKQVAGYNLAEAEEQEKANADLSSNFATNIGNYIQQLQDSPELMKQALESQGFSIENGQLVYKGDMPLTENQLKDLNTIYGIATGQYNNSIGMSSQGYSSAEEMLNNIVLPTGTSANTKGSGIINEVYALFNQFSGDNKPNDGYVAKLTNKDNENATVYLMYRNGKWHQVNSAAYQSASDTNKGEFKGKGDNEQPAGSAKKSDIDVAINLAQNNPEAFGKILKTLPKSQLDIILDIISKMANS